MSCGSLAASSNFVGAASVKAPIKERPDDLDEARELEAVLNRCKAIFEALPSPVVLNRQIRLTCELASAMEQARQHANNLPSEDELAAASGEARYLSDALEEAGRHWQSDDLPSEDGIERLAKPAAELVESLKEAAELQAG